MAEDRLQQSVQGIKDPSARKQEYYKRQREDAEEGGNQVLSDKINAKLGKKSSSVDTEAVNKGILGSIPFMAAPEGKLLASAAERAIPAIGKMAKGIPEAAESLLGRASRSAPKTVGKVVSGAVKAKPAASKIGKAIKSKASDAAASALGRASRKAPKTVGRALDAVKNKVETSAAKKAAGAKVKDFSKSVTELEKKAPRKSAGSSSGKMDRRIYGRKGFAPEGSYSK